MRMTTELLVTAPSGWTVLSNGTLIEALRRSADAGLWHWQRPPRAGYLVTLVAGPSRARRHARPVAAGALRRPRSRGRGWRSLGRTADMIEHFSALTGVAYPWSKYDRVAVHDSPSAAWRTPPSARSPSAACSTGAPPSTRPPTTSSRTSCYRWFGDLVTCPRLVASLAQQGFAAFFEHLDVERKDSRDAYLYNLKQHADAYFGETTRATAARWCAPPGAPYRPLRPAPLREGGLGAPHAAEQARRRAVFWAGVKEYLTRHQGRSVGRATSARHGGRLGPLARRLLQTVDHSGGHRAGLDALRRRGADLHVTLRRTETVDAVTPCFPRCR
ncbi:MAG: hypothetical protein IPF99_27035 [Deltaproteobacteria bacterium]|nr:hypothetical protein [Deltaproteobacteria bacterium]